MEKERDNGGKYLGTVVLLGTMLGAFHILTYLVLQQSSDIICNLQMRSQGGNNSQEDQPGRKWQSQNLIHSFNHYAISPTES